MGNDLIGVWKSDLNDPITQQFYGNVIIEFRANGELIYTVIEFDKEQKIFMTYEVNDFFLITDQVSYPQKVQTEFFLDTKRGRLELVFDGIRSKYTKVIDDNKVH